MNSKIDLLYMPEKTKSVFEILSTQKFISNYTLVGGSALSIQIKHRLSEDLDFIYDGDVLNMTTIKRNINKTFTNYQIIKQDSNYQIDFIINETKVTFFSSGAVLVPFNILSYSFKYGKINIARQDIIATLKLGAISQRNTIRDYYDLYFISKNYISLYKIIEKTKKLMPNLSPITYIETLIYTKDIEEDDLSNHLFPKEKITKQEISKYFINELKKIKNKI